MKFWYKYQLEAFQTSYNDDALLFCPKPTWTLSFLNFKHKLTEISEKPEV